MDLYYHTREYLVPVFNRRQILRFAYLCTRPDDDLQPDVFVGSLLKGARLERRPLSNMLYGVPVQPASWRGLILAIVAAVICGLYVHSVWVATAICTAIASAGQLLGIVQYKLEKRIWKLIAG